MDWYDWIWSESFWVPPGHTWDDLRTDKIKDMWSYPFIIAAGLLLTKYFFLTPFVFYPLGRLLNIKSKPHKSPPKSSKLELVHSKYRTKAPFPVVKETAKEIGWTERQVQRWLRQKAVSTQPTDLVKFDECAFQLVYYIIYSIFGIIVHYDKPWFYDIRHGFRNFPHHDMDYDIWWYYMIPLGFYWSQTLTHFLQTQRRDSFQMLAHHLVTIALISLSWVCNFVRIGTLVLLVHECADIPLLLAKISGYCNRAFLGDVCFALFLILWIITRLGIYPFHILNFTLFKAHVQENKFYPVYFVFNGLLLCIQLMHVIWTYYIIQVIVKKISTNQIIDVRSSGSDVSDDGEEYPPQQLDKKKD